MNDERQANVLLSAIGNAETRAELVRMYEQDRPRFMALIRQESTRQEQQRAASQSHRERIQQRVMMERGEYGGEAELRRDLELLRSQMNDPTNHVAVVEPVAVAEAVEPPKPVFRKYYDAEWLETYLKLTIAETRNTAKHKRRDTDLRGVLCCYYAHPTDKRLPFIIQKDGTIVTDKAWKLRLKDIFTGSYRKLFQDTCDLFAVPLVYKSKHDGDVLVTLCIADDIELSFDSVDVKPDLSAVCEVTVRQKQPIGCDLGLYTIVQRDMHIKKPATNVVGKLNLSINVK